MPASAQWFSLCNNNMVFLQEGGNKTFFKSSTTSYHVDFIVYLRLLKV